VTWTKLGCVVVERAGAPWASTHAALPVVDSLGNGRHRVYFSSRDDRGRARIGWVDADLSRRHPWLLNDVPAIDLGPLGGFADSGVTSSCLVNHAGVKYHFYTGWSLGVSVPF
jgi:hypothetical protein